MPPLISFETGRKTQTQSSAQPGRAETANGSLVLQALAQLIFASQLSHIACEVAFVFVQNSVMRIASKTVPVCRVNGNQSPNAVLETLNSSHQRFMQICRAIGN